MSKIDTEIRNRVEAFVAELTGLIRQAAVDAAVNALQGQVSTSGAKRGPKSASAAPQKAGTRVRRTEAQIQATMSKVLGYIESHPASRSEDIRAAINVEAPQMADALRRLMAEKSIKSKGSRRTTTYSKA
jgi:septum formation inhibitor MinC